MVKCTVFSVFFLLFFRYRSLDIIFTYEQVHGVDAVIACLMLLTPS